MNKSLFFIFESYALYPNMPKIAYKFTGKQKYIALSSSECEF